MPTFTFFWTALITLGFIALVSTKLEKTIDSQGKIAYRICLFDIVVDYVGFNAKLAV